MPNEAAAEWRSESMTHARFSSSTAGHDDRCPRDSKSNGGRRFAAYSRCSAGSISRIHVIRKSTPAFPRSSSTQFRGTAPPRRLVVTVDGDDSDNACGSGRKHHVARVVYYPLVCVSGLVTARLRLKDKTSLRWALWHDILSPVFPLTFHVIVLRDRREVWSFVFSFSRRDVLSHTRAEPSEG